MDEGLIKVFGHISARVPGEDRALILGHAHMEGHHLEQVTADDIITIDMHGKWVEGRWEPPGERYIHTEIYARRPDVQAVVHVHPPTVVALSIADQPILPCWMLATPFAPRVPIFQQTVQIDNPEVGRAMAECLGTARAIMFRSHGAATVGRSVEEASVLAVCLEETAKLQVTAALMGRVRTIPEEDLEGGYTRGLTSDEFFSTMWEYHSHKANTRFGVEG
ncbi:MAG: class II aldolase/adducin family protein [Deltaproteobacteria bacterium]|nr:class II aldolase/adducin family protein [Deltaproteobacteria bacterium]